MAQSSGSPILLLPVQSEAAHRHVRTPRDVGEELGKAG